MEKVQIVQVISVNPNATLVKKDGGTYKGLEFKYFAAGQPRTKGIHSSQLTRKADLVATLTSLAEGDTVELTLGEEPFFELLSVKPATGEVSAEQPESSTTFKKSFTKSTGSYVDNSTGMQVGNALTNATTLKAAGDKRSLEEVAVAILVLGENLKARLAAGEFANKPAEVLTSKKKVQEVVVEAEEEDDTPFSFGND